MREKRLLIGAVAFTALVLLMLSQLTVAPAALATGKVPAKVSWSQSPVTATLAAGSTYSTTVVFTSTVDLSNVTLRLTPSLKSVVTISPTTFVSITAGTPYTVSISVTLPAHGKRASYGGTLTVRAGNRAIAKPLPLHFWLQR